MNTRAASGVRGADRGENLALLAPGLALLALAFFLPIARMLSLSVEGAEGATLDHFRRFFGDEFYRGVLWRTVRLSLVITLICAVLGFPFAYIMSRAGPRARVWLLIVVILPLMTSVVVRTFGWMVILSRNGVLPELLRDLGLVGRSFQLMRTETAIVLGMVQVLMPFMVLSILGVLSRVDFRLQEAARTMGCGFLGAIRHVVLPLAMPGIAVGAVLVFTLSASSFVTPNLLGGPRVQVLAGSIYRSVTQVPDWPFAAAQAVVLFAGIVLVMAPYLARVGRGHG